MRILGVKRARDARGFREAKTLAIDPNRAYASPPPAQLADPAPRLKNRNERRKKSAESRATIELARRCGGPAPAPAHVVKRLFLAIIVALALVACSRRPGSTPGAPSVAAPAPTQTADAGGWGSSGGGYGVACWASPDEAKQADDAIANAKPFAAKTKSAIRSLVALETWEIEKKLRSWPNLSAREILAAVDARIADASPLFALRLEQLKPVIRRERWTANADGKAWRATEDAHPKRPLPPECRLAQLVIRRTDHRDAYAAYPDRLPRVRVDFDADLMALMSERDQALIETHERFYLLARSIGHATSDQVRESVVIVFAKEFWDRDLTIAASYKFQGDIIDVLGDYVLFFAGEPSHAAAARYSPESRYDSFLSGLRKIRERVVSCQERGGLKSGERAPDTPAALSIIERCKLAEYWVPKLTTYLTDEEMFLQFARGYLDHEGLGAYASEYLSVPPQNERARARSRAAVRSACGQALRSIFSARPRFGRESSFRSANYCARAIRARAFGFETGEAVPVQTFAEKGDPYFRDIPTGAAPYAAFSWQSRVQSAGRAAALVRASAESCERRLNKNCWPEAGRADALAPLLSDEEAFMLYAHDVLGVDPRPEPDGSPPPPSMAFFDGPGAPLTHAYDVACARAVQDRLRFIASSAEPFVDRVLQHCLDAAVWAADAAPPPLEEARRELGAKFEGDDIRRRGR